MSGRKLSRWEFGFAETHDGEAFSWEFLFSTSCGLESEGLPWHYQSLLAELNGGKKEVQNLPIKWFGAGLGSPEGEYQCLISHTLPCLLVRAAGHLRAPDSLIHIPLPPASSVLYTLPEPQFPHLKNRLNGATSLSSGMFREECLPGVPVSQKNCWALESSL